MLPNAADFLCIQILLIFPSVPPAVIGHLAKGPDPGFFSACARFGLLTFALLLLCVMEKTKLCRAGRQETCLLCAFTFTCRLSQQVIGRHQTGLHCSFRAQGQVKDFAFFFFLHKKSLNMNLILYKTLGQVVLDLKAKSKPARHLVLLLMEVKV